MPSTLIRVERKESPFGGLQGTSLSAHDRIVFVSNSSMSSFREYFEANKSFKVCVNPNAYPGIKFIIALWGKYTKSKIAKTELYDSMKLRHLGFGTGGRRDLSINSRHPAAQTWNFGHKAVVSPAETIVQPMVSEVRYFIALVAGNDPDAAKKLKIVHGQYRCKTIDHWEKEMRLARLRLGISNLWFVDKHRYS